MAHRKHQPVLEHYCSGPLTCSQCIHRFWVWAESYSQRHERQSRIVKKRLTSDVGKLTLRTQPNGGNA